jgi:hypothetical protein
VEGVMRVLPINNGNYQYKSIDGQIFKARLSKSEYGSIQGTCDVLEVEKQEYIIGYGKVNMDMDKTSNEFTKLFVLNMLSRFTGDKENFKVVLSAPPMVYRVQKDELPEYIIGDYEIVHNGKRKNIGINTVRVYPETIAAYVVNKDRFKSKNLIVLDVGGLTTNGVLITNNGFSRDDIFTLRHGMYHLDFEICQYLLGHCLENGFNCRVEDVQYFRDIRDSILDCEGVNDIYLKFIDTIVEAMDDMNWNYRKLDVLITGGGGKNLFETMQRFELPQAVLSNDPLFDNLKGLDVLAKQVIW